MLLIARHETLVAIRSLVEYMKDDERKHYQEQRERGEGDGHIYGVFAQIEKWLNGQPQVLYLVAGSDVSLGLPEAA